MSVSFDRNHRNVTRITHRDVEAKEATANYGDAGNNVDLHAVSAVSGSMSDSRHCTYIADGIHVGRPVVVLPLSWSHSNSHPRA